MNRSILASVMFLFAMLASSFHGQSTNLNASPAPLASPTPEAISAVTESLIGYAVKDFVDHQPPMPVKFRKVRIGHLANSDGSRSYRLCGEFLALDARDKKLRWMSFATIRTDPYEQYIGSSTLGYCTDKKMIWHKAGDLTSLMNKKLASRPTN